MNNLFMHGIRISVEGYCDRCGKQLREFDPGEPVCECYENFSCEAEQLGEIPSQEDIKNAMSEAVEELEAAMMKAVDAFCQVAQKIIEISNEIGFEEFRKAYFETKDKENSNP